MRWLSRLSIKAKVFLIIFVGGGAVSVLLFENYLFMGSALEEQGSMKQSDMPLVNITRNLQVNFIEMNELYQLALTENNLYIADEARDLAASMLSEIRRVPTLQPVLSSDSIVLEMEFSDYRFMVEAYLISSMKGSSSTSASNKGLKMEKQFSADILKEKRKVEKTLIQLSYLLNQRISDRAFHFLQRGEYIAKRDFTVGSWVLLLIVLLSLWFARLISDSIEKGINMADDISHGRWDIDIDVETKGHKELGLLGLALKTMRNNLREQHRENSLKDLVLYRSARLNEVLRGELTLQELGNRVLISMNNEINVLVGAFYEWDGNELKLISDYGSLHSSSEKKHFKLGESLVGQCGFDKKSMLLDDIPDDYADISTGMGSLAAKSIYLFPLLYNNVLKGVIELGAFDPFTDEAIEFVEKGAEGIAIAVHSAQSRIQLNEMLRHTQKQAREFEKQQNELLHLNKELEKQTEVMRVTEGNLQTQQEELKVLNEELEERSRLLDKQNSLILEKNRLLEDKKITTYSPSIKAKTDPNTKRKLTPGLLMIVEDDPHFSSILQEVSEEFCLNSVVLDSAESAMAYMESALPSAIILDMGLPGINGDEFIEYLKADISMQVIPVHVLSGNQSSSKALALGVENYLLKPAPANKVNELFLQIKSDLSTEPSSDYPTDVKYLLIVEDDKVQGEALREQFADKSIVVDLVLSGKAARSAVKLRNYDCVVLDLNLNDCDGFGLLKELRRNKALESVPVIIYTAMDVSVELGAKLRKYADRIILKAGTGMRRVHDEAALFLNWVDINNKEVELEDLVIEGFEKPKSDLYIPESSNDFDAVLGANEKAYSPLDGKRILLVDDDVRNLYSLSAILEDQNVILETAMNGREAVDTLLKTNSTFDLIMMDIMMPEMDGYEAIRIIRSHVEYKNLPIIAVTAKAMKEDRVKCLDVGANDYLTKPIDVEKLIGILKIWLRKTG